MQLPVLSHLIRAQSFSSTPEKKRKIGFTTRVWKDQIREKENEHITQKNPLKATYARGMESKSIARSVPPTPKPLPFIAKIHS